MRPRQAVPDSLRQLAALQAQVLTREQALGAGFGRHGVQRLVEGGSWRRLAPGVYLTTHLTPPWDALAWAGVLLGGPAARVGGRAAGFLHGLVEGEPTPIAILVPHRSSPPRVGGPWRFHREREGVRSPLRVGNPPRLPVEDTLLDLVSGSTSLREIVELVTTAVQSRRTPPQRILAAVHRRRLLPHRALMLKLLDDVAQGARSPLEVDYLHDVERAHGLPSGARQSARGNSEVDVEYEEYGLLVELDGRRGHEGLDRFRDMRRDNRSTSDGLATLRYGSVDVYGDPCGVARQVAQNLTRRGWPGQLVPCVHCRAAA